MPDPRNVKPKDEDVATMGAAILKQASRGHWIGMDFHVMSLSISEEV